MAKKFKITNNILATAVIIAIVISAGGTWIALNQLTGKATSGDASSNLTIDTVTAIELISSWENINWGGGYVWGNSTVAILWSENNTHDGGSWDLATNGQSSINITNAGNTWINITLSSSHSAATLFAGTDGAPAFQYNVTCADAETSCCPGATSIANMTDTGYTNVSVASSQIMCVNMSYADDNDEIALFTHLAIPGDEVPGSYNVTFTINAAAV